MEQHKLLKELEHIAKEYSRHPLESRILTIQSRECDAINAVCEAAVTEIKNLHNSLNDLKRKSARCHVSGLTPPSVMVNLSEMKTKINGTNTFPTLYSLNSDGSVQEWTISVRDATIHKTYGRVGGSLMKTSDTIREGKNIGRANETTPHEQAFAEAQSAWEKKQKSGYNENVNHAKAGKVSAVHIAGGIEPMLAQKWRDHSAKIQFPAFMQPKLDGIRCIAMLRNGKCTLWTRTRKPIKSMPHIVAELEAIFAKKNIVLDGELYNHAYKDKFEQIVSLVRPDAPKVGHEVVQYYVYDVVGTGASFAVRSEKLAKEYLHRRLNLKHIVVVETIEVGEDDVTECFTAWRKQGYEGAMIRNAASLYENKRSYGLQKIKEFDDAEFEIVGVESGRGRMSECAIFVCETKKGEEFRCKMEGSLDALKDILKFPKKIVGKKLTVRYQGITNGGVPRFPIGVSVRDYE